MDGRSGTDSDEPCCGGDDWRMNGVIAVIPA